MKILRIFAALVVATVLAGCGHAEYFKLMAEQVRIQGDLAVKGEELKIEKVKAEKEKWAAMKEGATTDMGRVMLGVAVLASEISGGAKAADSKPVLPVFNVPPPRDFVDYLNAGANMVGALGNILVPINRDNKSAKVQIASLEAGVEQERVRQNGENGRINRSPAYAYNIDTGGGDALVGNNNRSDRRDQRDCRSFGGQGGTGAPSGGVNLGNLTSGAGALSGFILTPGYGGAGAAGGNASTGC